MKKSPKAARGQPKAPKKRVSHRERREATRKAIKEGAAACFRDYGYSETTIADILERSGVSKATFYLHFENKEAVALESFTDLEGTVRDRLMPILAAAPSTPLPETLRRTAGAMLDFFEEHREFKETFVQSFSLMLAANLSQSDPAGTARPRLAQGFAAFADMFGLDFPDPEAMFIGVTTMWVRMAVSFLDRTADARSKKDRAETIERMTETTLRIYGAFSTPASGRAKR